jgi:hypothetical protein
LSLAIALRPQTPTHIRGGGLRGRGAKGGGAGHITLTPANQWIVIGLKIWSLSNPDFEPGTFLSLAQRAYHLANRAYNVCKDLSNKKIFDMCVREVGRG